MKEGKRYIWGIEEDRRIMKSHGIMPMEEFDDAAIEANGDRMPTPLEVLEMATRHGNCYGQEICFFAPWHEFFTIDEKDNFVSIPASLVGSAIEEIESNGGVLPSQD